MISKNASTFSKVPEPLVERAAACFQALADPTRLRILRELKEGDKSVQELVSRFRWSQANISRHLSVLSQAGLVKKAKRGSFVFYGIANDDILRLCDLVCSHVNRSVAGLIPEMSVKPSSARSQRKR
jgi:DNA-binding transcriptional ArsR family regulator